MLLLWILLVWGILSVIWLRHFFFIVRLLSSVFVLGGLSFSILRGLSTIVLISYYVVGDTLRLHIVFHGLILSPQFLFWMCIPAMYASLASTISSFWSLAHLYLVKILVTDFYLVSTMELILVRFIRWWPSFLSLVCTSLVRAHPMMTIKIFSWSNWSITKWKTTSYIKFISVLWLSSLLEHTQWYFLSIVYLVYLTRLHLCNC